jgi:hypothetical protein
MSSQPSIPQTVLRRRSLPKPADFAVIVILVLAWILSTPAVRASTCGHYLYRNGKPVAHHDSLPQAVAQTADQSAPMLPISPCDGPGCRRSSVPLELPPVTTRMTTQSRVAALLQEILAQAGPRPGSVLPESEDGEFHEAQGIFRPPAA